MPTIWKSSNTINIQPEATTEEIVEAIKFSDVKFIRTWHKTNGFKQYCMSDARDRKELAKDRKLPLSKIF